MKVGLFIPCYVDQFYPEVGIATVKLLDKLGIHFEYPMKQTCCGQPMGNAGYLGGIKKAGKNLIDNFRRYTHIICPSGSCTSFVRNHYQALEGIPALEEIQKKTYELCEFLIDVLKVPNFDHKFPYKVGIHNSCHGHRELKLASASELIVDKYSKLNDLLVNLDGIELVALDRIDECCGFGGTFAVNEEAISCKMGRDRIADHVKSGAQVMTGVDMSCLMHMDGLIQRNGSPIKAMHIAQILAGETP